jgi:4-hydroxy-tetrahydrodipicolinate synthase
LRAVEGVITALVTPFDRDGEVMEDAVRSLVDFQAEAGVNGLFLCGTAGLGAVMRPAQRRRVFEAASEAAAGRVSVIAHVGAPSTEEAVELARHAEAAGVDAIGCVTPYYFTPDEASIIEHYRRVAGAVDLPVYVYNIPRNAITNIQPELMLRLCEIENIAGVKDSSRDFVQVLEYLQVLPEDRAVICGTDSYILPALIMGARGAITGYANAFPEVYVDFYKSFLKGDYEAAKRQQFMINLLRKAMQRPPIAPYYEALRLRGIEAGCPRAPLRPMNPKEAEGLKAKLEELGVLQGRNLEPIKSS